MSLVDETTTVPNLSRRNWMKLAGMGATALTASPFISACAQQSAHADTADAPANSLAIMSSNENPFGPSPKAVEAMKAELPNIYRYTYPSVVALTEQIDLKSEQNGAFHHQCRRH